MSIAKETIPLEIRHCVRFQRAIELVGKRWTGAIVRTLFHGPQRFNAILAAIPDLSDRLLAERLKELESEGLIQRDVSPGPPVCVSYELTEAGSELQEALTPIGSWAERWMTLAPKP